MSEFDVTLPDGRTLHVYDEGDPGGHAVVFQHGTRLRVDGCTRMTSTMRAPAAYA